MIISQPENIIRCFTCHKFLFVVKGVVPKGEFQIEAKCTRCKTLNIIRFVLTPVKLEPEGVKEKLGR